MPTSFETTISADALRDIVANHLGQIYGEHADLESAIARGAVTFTEGEYLLARTVTFRRIPTADMTALLSVLLYDGGQVLITRTTTP